MPEIRVDNQRHDAVGVVQQAISAYLQQGVHGNSCVVFAAELFNLNLWNEEAAGRAPHRFEPYAPRRYIVGKAIDGGLAIYKVPEDLHGNPLSAAGVDMRPIYKGKTVTSIVSFLMTAVEVPEAEDTEDDIWGDRTPLQFRVSLCSLKSKKELLSVHKNDYWSYKGREEMRPRLEEFIQLVHDEQR